MFSFLQKSSEQLEREQLKAKIDAAQPEEKYRRPTPLGDAQFPEHNFITFEVTQDNQPIKLHTYRYPQPNVSTSPRSIVVLFHGLNGHLGNYAHIAKALSEETGSVINFVYFRPWWDLIIEASEGARASEDSLKVNNNILPIAINFWTLSENITTSSTNKRYPYSYSANPWVE